MGRSKWLLLLLIPMLFGFDTRNPFRTLGPFKAYDFTIGAVGGKVYVCSGEGPTEGGSVKSTPGCGFLDQPFVSSPQDDFGPTKIADSRYFMMGDNRADSDDSRNWGSITKEQMIGIAFMSYWPPSRISIW